MLDNILQLLDSNKKVLVIGEVILDKYIYGCNKRISSEVPIPVFSENKIEYRLGGAGNVALNLISFGLSVELISLSDLTSYDILKDILTQYNINYENIIIDTEYILPIKSRFISNNYQCFRSDKENYEYSLNNKIETKIKNIIDKFINNVDCIIISDYNNGLITYNLSQYIIKKANTIPVIVDPKKGDYKKFIGSTIIKPNKNDAEYFCHFKIQDTDSIRKACSFFIDNLKVNYCILTLSDKGMVIYDGYNIKYISVENKLDVIDVTGAGDTVIATICLGIINHIKMDKICYCANIFASNVIQKFGTCSVDIINIIKKYNMIIKSYDDLNKLSKYIKKSNKKLVFTTGCFDLIHMGHIESLKQAKSYGDYLFVALNSDESIKKNKGYDRPICDISSRLSVLSSIKYVDFIMIFNELTPVKVFDILDPEVIVKGNDYNEDEIIKIFPNAKNFVGIDLINNYSTTNIINKIKNISSKTYDFELL